MKRSSGSDRSGTPHSGARRDVSAASTCRLTGRTEGYLCPGNCSPPDKIRRVAVDRLLKAELVFPGGCTGLITASMLSRHVVGAGARVSGTRGTMKVISPYHPKLWHRLAVRSNTRRAVEHLPRQPSTYASQLRAFIGAILRGEPLLTGLDDAVANMTVIDACYAAAGLPRREPSQ